MSVRDLITAAFNKDAASFEDTLNVVMQEKMAAAVQARFSPAVYEEEIDLDESKDEDDEDEDDDEEVDLEEEIKDGDKVSWHDPNVGKNVTGVVTMASGMKRKGIKHAQVRVDNSHGTTTKVPHSQLKKIEEEVDQIDEISGAKLGTYMIKARKSEAELDKKRDDSYDKPNTPENKAERKAISRTLNKRRWGHGKALDKLTGSSFAKVHATEK